MRLTDVFRRHTVTIRMSENYDENIEVLWSVSFNIESESVASKEIELIRNMLPIDDNAPYKIDYFDSSPDELIVFFYLDNNDNYVSSVNSGGELVE